MSIQLENEDAIKASIEQDPFVMDLIHKMGASIISGSIKPMIVDQVNPDSDSKIVNNEKPKTKKFVF